MLVLVQPLLKDAAAEIVRLPHCNLADRLAQRDVADARLAGRLGEPSRLEHAT
jgi:hypothetical protein